MSAVLSCHHSAGSDGESEGLRVALVGNPNVGKSTIFNGLTGLDALTTNYPGTTVEVAVGKAGIDGTTISLIDLPGTYGVPKGTGDERAAWEALSSHPPDAVLAVVDATNLARNLYLVLRLLELRFRIVVALNMSDEARRGGLHIDSARLSALLGVPVIPTVAPTAEGLHDALRACRSVAAAEAPAGDPDWNGQSWAIAAARERHARAEWIAQTVSSGRDRRRESWRIATRPSTGIPLLAAVLGTVFAALFWGGTALAGLVDRTWAAYASPLMKLMITAFAGGGPLGRTLLWGLDAGLNAVLSVGIPYVLTFYLMLALLEDTGYLNAAAIVLDRTLSRMGLTGRAAIPLVAGAGCNVPAIIGLRVLRTERERLIAGTLITLVPCSARTAVIFGAVAALAGPWWAALLYAIVAVVILGAGWGLNRMLPGASPALLMEMFPFRVPSARTVLRKTWFRVREFIVVAVPIVLAGSVVLGALYETGLIRLAARPLAPLVEGWLGLPAVAGLTLVFAVLRKELALQLLLALALVEYGRGAHSLLAFMTTRQIFTYALVNTLYIPCAATIAVLTRALGWRRAALISGGTIMLAVVVGGVVTRLLALVLP